METMTKPARTITCSQVTLAEAADTLETSPVNVEVMAGMGKNSATVGIFIHWNFFCINSHVKRRVPGVGQFVGDGVMVVASVTVVVSVTTAGEVDSVQENKRLAII